TVAPKRDLKLEPLVEVLEGKRLVHCHAYRADEMLMMIRVAEEFGFKITSFEHVQEGYKIAKEMAKHGVAGAGFSDWWSYKMEVIDGIPYNMALMTKKGVLSAINSDSGELMRRLNTEAAKTMRYGGLTEDQALALITINPAKHLKVDHLVGSLEPGKSADVVIWNKHPLSVYAVAQKVFIDGNLYFDREKDIRERAEKAARKKALEEKLKREAQQAAPSRRSTE
ncbi:MAG: amidohydrolase family protein, partial [Bryobacteraceae bacterium]|nr:amidohydrolase family protein [Bryobacteraceae bacterium]